MSTPGERLEATVWLDARYPDLPEAERTAFYAAVDEYYAQYPIADRRPHALDILRQDDRVFAEFVDSILGREHPADAD